MKSSSTTIINDARVINELAQQHPANPDGFIQSLDAFFREMCREMANRKGGKS